MEAPCWESYILVGISYEGVIAHYDMNSCAKRMEIFCQKMRRLRPPLPDNGSLEECNSGKVKSENR